MISGFDLRLLPIFILAMGCAGGAGKLIGLSAVAFIIEYFSRKSKMEKNDFMKSTIVKQSCIILGVFLGMQLIAGLFSPDMDGIREIGRYLERMAPFFLIILFAKGNKNFLKVAFLGVCVGTLITCGFAWQYWFIHHVRPASTVGGPNQLGAHLTLLIPMLLAGTYWCQKKSTKLFGILSTLFAIGTLILSGSRGAGGGLMILLVMTLVYYLVKDKCVWKKILIISFMLLLTLGLAIVVLNSPFGQRGDYDLERTLLRQAAWAMFLDHPIVGIGYGNFNEIYRLAYISPLAQAPWLDTPHNLVLRYLSEMGIVGFLGFFSLICFQIRCLYQIAFDKKTSKQVFWLFYSVFIIILAMLIHGVVDTAFMDRSYNTAYWFVWGMTCYGIYLVKKQEQ
ncbi:MAG: O-antigen ligase family protein [Acidaminococcaceae bacterium]